MPENPREDTTQEGYTISGSSVATEQINTFLPDQEAFAPPIEEAVFVLTTSELKAIISAAVTEAVKTALERVSDLEADVSTLTTEIVELRTSSAAEIERVCVDIATDRRRLCQLEQSRATALPPGNKTTARIAHIKTILKDRGATTFKELCRILDISAREMSRLVKRLDMRFFEITRRPGDARQKVLRLRSQIG